MNVHAFTLNEALPNGNDSGIGIVIRDDKGIVIKMMSDTIHNLAVCVNELWNLLAGEYVFWTQELCVDENRQQRLY